MWGEIGRLVLALAGVVGAFSAIGLAYTDWWAPNVVTRLDERVADSAADHRTALLNDVAPWAAFPADTLVKIGISVVIVGVFMWRWRRWYEAVYVALPLVFEATAFIVTTHLVGRDRPPVEPLLESEVTTSFPSGHVAAATVYAAVAVIAFGHTRAAWARALAVVLAVAIPLGVGWARVYQGMHYLSDVMAGIGLGLVSLTVTHLVLRPHAPAAGGDPLRSDAEPTRPIAGRSASAGCPCQAVASSSSGATARRSPV